MLEEVSDLRFQRIVNVFNVIVTAQLAVRNHNQFRIFASFVGHFSERQPDGNGSQNPAAAGTESGPVRQLGSPSRDRSG